MTMYGNGGTLARDDVEMQRAIEESLAKAAYQRSQQAMAKSEAPGVDVSRYWYWRQQAMMEQINGDQHAYAENILARLLNPPAVATYVPHDDHIHKPADGADGRDAHAS